MLGKLIDWLIGCSYAGDPASAGVLLLSVARCVVRFALVVALLYALARLGLGL